MLPSSSLFEAIPVPVLPHGFHIAYGLMVTRASTDKATMAWKSYIAAYTIIMFPDLLMKIAASGSYTMKTIPLAQMNDVTDLVVELKDVCESYDEARITTAEAACYNLYPRWVRS